MPEYRVKRIDDMEAAYWGSFKRVRAELGLSAFGVQVLDLPPNAEQYPEHDHSEDGQEEMYVFLRGGGEMEIEGERHEIGPDTLVSVTAGTKRKVYPGDEGVRLLIIGGKPGEAYEVPPSTSVTELGAPDPSEGQDSPQ